ACQISMMLDCCEKLRTATGSKQSVMEFFVSQVDRTWIACGNSFVVAALNRLELSEQVRCGGQRNALRGSVLQNLTQLANLFNFLCSEIAHRSAAIGCAHDNSHTFEIGQSLAHDVTLCAKALHQCV